MGTSNLNRLYPSKTLTFEGVTVIVKPLAISQLPLVSDVIIKAKSLIDVGKSEADVVLSMMPDILGIAENCLDKPLSEIPLAMTPEICSVIVKQNMSKDILGKWQALKGEVEAAFALQGQN